MAVELITTPGATDANSYVSLEEAAAYFETDPQFAAIWETIEEDDTKEQWLISATRAVDRIDFIGGKYHYNQSLQFPRDVPDRTGVWFTSSELPPVVKDGTCEMVKYLYHNQDSTTGQVEREIRMARLEGKVTVEYEPRDSSSNKYVGSNIETVRAVLRDWLVGSESSIRIVK